MLSEKLSYPDLCDKPILEVSHQACHENGNAKQAGKGIQCVNMLILYICRQDEKKKSLYWGREEVTHCVPRFVASMTPQALS